MVVDGESVLDTKLRMANIELINTIGVSKENLTACLECHCPGAVSCCRCVFCLCSSGTRVGLPVPAHVWGCLCLPRWVQGSLVQCKRGRVCVV